jgi:hypothetical protein
LLERRIKAKEKSSKWKPSTEVMEAKMKERTCRMLELTSWLRNTKID